MKNLSLASVLAAGFTLTLAPAVFAATSQAPATPQAPATQAPKPAMAMDHDDLEDRVLYRLETNPMVRKYDIDVDVKDGVVTLTGDVATAAQKAEAEKVAKMDGVTRVDNKIDIDPDEDKAVSKRIADGMNKTGEKISDGWITTKVNWFFVGEDLLDDSDINVDTKDNVVTLKGFVKTEAGRARAVELAKDTDGVKKVVDQLKIRTSAR